MSVRQDIEFHRLVARASNIAVLVGCAGLFLVDVLQMQLFFLFEARGQDRPVPGFSGLTGTLVIGYIVIGLPLAWALTYTTLRPFWLKAIRALRLDQAYMIRTGAFFGAIIGLPGLIGYPTLLLWGLDLPFRIPALLVDYVSTVAISAFAGHMGWRTIRTKLERVNPGEVFE